jgi:hypothetical protein
VKKLKTYEAAAARVVMARLREHNLVFGVRRGHRNLQEGKGKVVVEVYSDYPKKLLAPPEPSICADCLEPYIRHPNVDTDYCPECCLHKTRDSRMRSICTDCGITVTSEN